MKPVSTFLAAIGIVAIVSLATGAALAQNGPPSQVLPEGIRGGSEVVPEPRVQIRKYLFETTNEELPYSVFVSSKIKPGEQAPLIIALRGFTGTTLTFVRGTAVDLAEDGGYILVGPIGYNNRAGFGVPPRTRTPPSPARTAPRELPPLVGGTAETDPAKISQYSEQDVMSVLALVRKEFAIDERRIYLMGHSQGGGGARHLAEKYSDVWAAVALLAPAIFDVALTVESKIIDVPLMIAIGEQDFLIEGVRGFHRQLESLQISHEYVEMRDLDHGTIIMGSMPEVFRFFPKHVKQEL
jgi:predicted esterase